MKRVIINNNTYEVIENHKDAFDQEDISEKMTDYFEPYDYIVGDIMCGKLRLKGFCNKNNKRFNSINDFSKKDDYLKQNCPYVEKYFVLKKINEKENEIIKLDKNEI